ncbi:MAG: hypothetical protein KBB01_05010 [Candidatus Omnitrophica bacterium]|jgi:hypothetical protein|nr:hypothetical protein [Candidatus Omnitrophota bacterium]
MAKEIFKVSRDKKITFLKKHRIMAKNIFENKDKNKELEKIFFKICKKEHIYSQKTSDIDIFTGMYNIWRKIKEV